MATVEFDNRARRDRAFRRARSHSSLVRFLRRALPVGALAGFTAFVIAGSGLLHDTEPTVDVSNISLESGEVAMENPRVQGTSNSGQVYDIKSERAFQDITNPQRVRFIGVEGTIAAAGQLPTRISARQGVFYGEDDRIALSGGVVVVRPDNEQMTAEKMEIDLDSGSMSALGEIEMSTDNGQMQASEMLVAEDGDKVAFEGPVKVILHYRAADHQKQREQNP